jgi:hypothetical protein
MLFSYINIHTNIHINIVYIYIYTIYIYIIYIYKMYFERVMGMYMLILVLFHISYFSGLSIKMTL